MKITIKFVVIILAFCGVCCGRKAETQPASPSPSPIAWQTIEPPQRALPAGTPGQQKREPIKTFSGTGVVVLVNLKEGWIEVDHEDIPDVMPAMQMEWSVKNKSMLASIQAGDKVDFTIEDDNGTQTIIRLSRRP